MKVQFLKSLNSINNIIVAASGIKIQFSIVIKFKTIRSIHLLSKMIFYNVFF